MSRVMNEILSMYENKNSKTKAILSNKNPETGPQTIFIRDYFAHQFPKNSDPFPRILDLIGFDELGIEFSSEKAVW